MNNKIFAYAKYFIYLIAWLLIFFVVIYFHPTSEYMNCNSEYSCNVTHEYFHKFKYYKHIQLNKNSTLSYKLKHRIISLKAAPVSNSYYVYYDNKSPFVYYFHSIYNGEDAVQNEMKNFDYYKTHPQANYYIKSQADPFNFYLYLIGFIIIFILFIYVYLEEYKSKRINN